MEVRRHMTVLALTPTRLVYSHTDEHPAEDPQSRPRAEDVHRGGFKFSRVSSVSLTRGGARPGGLRARRDDAVRGDLDDRLERTVPR